MSGWLKLTRAVPMGPVWVNLDHIVIMDRATAVDGVEVTFLVYGPATVPEDNRGADGFLMVVETPEEILRTPPVYPVLAASAGYGVDVIWKTAPEATT